MSSKINQKTTLIQKEVDRIKSKDDNKRTFIGRNVILYYFLLFGLYPIASIYSAFTGGSALLVYINSTVNHFTVAIVMTVVFIACIELAKFFFGSAVSEDVRSHVWTESTEHIFAFTLKSVAFIGVFSASIILSLTGAPDVAHEYRETRTPVENSLVDLDAIKAEYDNKILAERKDIEHASNMTWQGAIIKDGRQIIKQAKDNINSLEKSRQGALNEANAKNEQIRNEYNSETQKASNWFLGFAGGGELLAILILLFVANYKSGSEKEVLTVALNNEHSLTHDTQQYSQLSESAIQDFLKSNPNVLNNVLRNALHNEKPTEKRRIGFEIPTVIKDNTKGSGSCVQCGSEYKKNVSWQRFCSTECRLDHHAQKNNGKRFDPNRYHSINKD